MPKSHNLSLTEQVNVKKVDSLVQKLEAIGRMTEIALNEIQSIKARNSNPARTQIDFFEEVKRYEIELIAVALELCHGNQRQAAKMLNLNPTTINTKIKRYRIGQSSGSSIAAK